MTDDGPTFTRDLLEKMIQGLDLPEEGWIHIFQGDSLINEMMTLLETEEPSLLKALDTDLDFELVHRGLFTAARSAIINSSNIDEATFHMAILLSRGMRTAAMMAALRERRSLDI